MRARGVTSRCTLAAAGLLAACAGPYGRVRETYSSTVSPTRFKTIVVIAGENDAGDLQIAVQVREKLTASGLTALNRTGLWETEGAAVAEICPPASGASGAESPPGAVDGVLFVWWNRMTLHDCETRKAAYQIDAAYTGVDNMIKRLLGYLRRPAAT